MLAKNDVLSEFKNVRSYERVDLLCSLLDLCLPYELRFLGTCLEFLGKRDFIELREDERHANNVNHITQYRSLMDENTRRKLVLYVSLLKSCNSDCANCLNDTLTALCISDVSQVCRAEPEYAEKLLDELLLLYTIAVKHPAFSLHQKTEFAAHLSRLQEEDNRLSQILYSNEDGITSTSRISKSVDCIPETPCKPKDSPSNNIEDSSSQISVNSQANQLTCHVLSGSVYTSAVLPSALHQASATCLNPAHVMVSSMCGHNASTVVAPSPGDIQPESASHLSGETGHSVIAVGLTASPVTSNLMVGPGPGLGPGIGLPLTSTSHCMMPSSGDIQKGSMGHPNIIGPMMCVPSDSMAMSYPGHAHYSMMVPIVSHIPGPPLGCPASMAPTMTPPGASLTLSNIKPVTSSAPPGPSPSSIPSKPIISCSSPSATTVSITSKENSIKSEQGEALGSQPVSPANTPPPGPKAQVSNMKPSGPLSHNPHQLLQQSHLPASNQPQVPPSSQQPYQLTHNMFPTSQHQLSSPKTNSTIVNQVQYYPNQIMSIGSFGQHPQSPHVSKFPGQWCPPGENLKEVIVREMPNYKANLQDYSPDELLYMSDDQLKDIGLSTSAIQQLRSIISKLHSPTNGLNCLNRSDAAFLNEQSSRRRHYHPSDNKAVPSMQGPPPGTVNYAYMVPSSYPNSINNIGSNGSSFNKGSKRHLQITNQVRALQLEDDSRRPCSNSSSTSDCSSGSHSPPETPSLPHISEVPCDHHLDRGYSGKDSGAESWNSANSDDKNRDDRLHEGERVIDDRSRGCGNQPPGVQRNLVNRSRGLSKAPPGIPTIPRGRGHPMADKNRRDPVSSMNGVPSDMNNQPPPYAMSGATGLPSSVPYPAPPVSSFLPHTPFTTMHAFHRFQSGSFLPSGTAYPFPPNGEMWSPFHQPPQPTHPYITAPIVAFSPAHPPPKLSCYNCGRPGHQGSDCKESTFEEITQQGQYHLDYKPGDCRDADK
ncbi:uncharacterized protein LOC117647116 isoform X3 [Thrips palmi]|uniref:Uncharacterized protein LOC117647116 isoform X3 n=1 Tax=Thrips palmi TaxID=161013 RepID=A0A6P8Z457_THRPL|nr:uncharacterized protein LOC117647116 isoform X3 [Thrips palmi]